MDLITEELEDHTEAAPLRRETQQQIEVTSPNRVTVVIPEDQLQTGDDKEDGDEFSPVIKRRN